MDPNTAEGQGQEQTTAPVQPDVQTESQPEAGSPDPSQSSQGLIEPYLEGIDPTSREQVAGVLERFRADQDARVNEKLSKEAERRKAYEQYGEPEQVGLATQIVNSFMADPVSTTEWLIEQGQSELGVDIMAELTREVKASQDPATGEASDEPITASKLLELLDKRESQKSAEAKRHTVQEQQAEQARARALGWFEEAVDRHNVPVDGLPDGVKNAMFARAQEIRQSNLARDGQTAIDMAVAEFGKAFSQTRSPKEPATPEPTVATGGTSPPPAGFDVTNDKQRRQAMLDSLSARVGS